MSHRVTARMLLALASGAVAAAVGAAPNDPNLDHPHRVVEVKRGDYSIAGLVTHLEGAKAFKYGIALFPGHPGIMELHEKDGRPEFGLRGNFLTRARRHWLDGETLVTLIDAPSDYWNGFPHEFRASPRYGADVAALLREVGRQFGVSDWTFVGTSEGSVSAYHAARMNPDLARRTILTASLFRPQRQGPGLSEAKWEGFPGKLLWVHHEKDPCDVTPYADAQAHAKRSASPLVTVRGGASGRGKPCQAFTAHGFVGLEQETVRMMRDWVKTGTAPGTVQ